MQDMNGMSPGMQGIGQAPWGQGTGPQQQIAAAPAKTGFGLESLKADWQAASTPKKLLLGMGPFLILAVIFAWPDDGAGRGTGPRPAGSGSAGTSASMTGTAPGQPPVGLGGNELPVANPANMNPATNPAVPNSGVQMGVSSPIPTPPISSAPSAASAKGTAPATPSTSSKKSQERLAADAWTEGNFEVAAKIYDQLSQQHPENPAFREAARICRDKMNNH
jgi:hypothetical protein